jgi:ADP-ribosylglycohydrolase
MESLDYTRLTTGARGSLLGAAIGDAMGAPCEGLSAATIRARYGILTDFVSTRSVGTDDTDFTLFNAHILLTHGHSVTPEQVEAEWRDKLLATGRSYRPGGFSDVISTRNLRAGLHAPASGAFGHQMWSDGVAMATSAAGILCPGDPQEAARLAAILGAVSNARDGIYAAQAVAAAISVALAGADCMEMADAAIAAVPANCWTKRAMVRAKRVALTAGADEAGLEAMSQELVVSYWPWADLATEAIPLAFAALLATQGDFAKAVPFGVRFGRDADTIGAIVGSMAGALGGEQAIPERWRIRVQASTGACIGFVADRQITDIADQLSVKAWEAYGESH